MFCNINHSFSAESFLEDNIVLDSPFLRRSSFFTRIRPFLDISAPPVDNPHDEKAMEFSISRLVRKDGVSSYYVNEVLSSRGGVVQKLKDYGVDLDHNRFLILQGEVEQISMMKPTAKSEHEEGMLEYLEDIIGSNRLKEPIIKFDELIEQLSGEMETSESTSHRLRTDMNGK